MRLPTLFALSLLLAPAALAVPPNFTHQGRLIDQLGVPLDGTHSLHINVYDVPSGGVSLWDETVTPDFDNGYYSVVLGEAVAFDTSVYDGQDLWLGIAVDTGAELPAAAPGLGALRDHF